MPKILNDRAMTRTQAFVIPKQLLLNLLTEQGLSLLTLVTGGVGGSFGHGPECSPEACLALP